MPKSKKQKPVTAKRLVFQQALKVIRKHVGKDGEIDFSNAADELTLLLDKAPRSGWLAEEWAICSALWANAVYFGEAVPEEVDEHCKGGELFLVAYFLGLRSSIRNRSKSK